MDPCFPSIRKHTTTLDGRIRGIRYEDQRCLMIKSGWMVLSVLPRNTSAISYKARKAWVYLVIDP